MMRDLLRAETYGFRKIYLKYGNAVEIERTLQLTVVE